MYRSELMEQFKVSVNKASTDLNRYVGFAPDNMVYDRSAQTYIRGPEFKALLYYTLRQLGLATDPNARRPQNQQSCSSMLLSQAQRPLPRILPRR